MMRSSFIAGTLLLAGCSSEVTKVEASLAGDAGKYVGFPVCIEVSYQNSKSLGLYSNNLCSSEKVSKEFQVLVSGQADDPETDVFNASGKVFLKANAMEIEGVVSARAEEQDGDTVTISVAVSF